MHLNHLLSHNQAALEELTWAIESSQGQFPLLLARCDYANLREALIHDLPKQCDRRSWPVTRTGAAVNGKGGATSGLLTPVSPPQQRSGFTRTGVKSTSPI